MRRKKTDTITSVVQVINSKPIEPPDHIKLRIKDFPFWEAIVCARARDSWNTVDLGHAANLARCMSDIETLSVEIEDEGNTLENKRGTKVVNPKHALLETLSRRSVALSRMLHVHAEATQGRARDTGQRTKKEKELLASQPQSDLLAKPIIQ